MSDADLTAIAERHVRAALGQGVDSRDPAAVRQVLDDRAALLTALRERDGEAALLRPIVEELAAADPLHMRYHGDDQFHDECFYCQAEPSAGEAHDPERCLHERAQAAVRSLSAPAALTSTAPLFVAGYRAGQAIAGHRCGAIIGEKVGAAQEAARLTIETQDRQQRQRLSMELGSSAALSWEEITRRIATLHRERYHFEALARDAGAV